MIDVGSHEDFPALAKRIKSGMEDQGNAITGMKKARNGGMLLEVRGDDSVVESIRAKVAISVGQDVNVRLFQQKTLLEIRDIDAWSNREDIVASIASEADVTKDNVRVVNLRTSFGDSQTALVLLPFGQTRDVIKKGRLRISVVSCRVREAVKRNTRCFKCLAFGHEFKECHGTDRRSNCRRCGKTGHMAKDCTADVTEAAAFRSVFEKETEDQYSSLQ